ncbi:DNRLRE domain-containing protein [Paenibacillus sp. FSL P4-0338]|uniref:CBM96 family carbohydrate-binding protein n=1 Tax=unclassified Paenibacillus TaxID=185978 RepID=UPI0003E218FD|nr:DNRLRE domain-containing protein [Paenibacillus sp. FSL R7-269]ETT56228.1 Fibronectin type III domain-containing protein [Paenibacillus sp. FSL R7-269]
MKQWLHGSGKRFGWILPLVGLILVLSAVAVPGTARAAGTITLDEPPGGYVSSGGPVEVSGTYTGLYDVRLYVNGTAQFEALLEDPDGDDSGSWSYTLDTSRYSGEVELVARGLDTTTRYGVWSSSVTLEANNPAGVAPVVTITGPDEGIAVTGQVAVTVQAESATPVSDVQVRVNRGPWQQAAYNGTEYVYSWSTAGIVDRTISLEARAANAPGRYGYSATVYAQVGAGTHEPAVPLPDQDRAMWIWEPESYKLLLNPGSREVLESFVTDTATFGSEPVTTLYLAVGNYAGYRALEEQEDELRSFMRWAHERNLSVHALVAGGTSPAYMGAYERYHHHAVREIEQIINYNLAAEEDEKFDGINVDIEPYISPDFKAPSKFLQNEYLDGLRKMIDRRDTAGIRLPFGPAVPKWYDSSEQGANIQWNGTTKWLSEHIQDISDYISIMDYRDSADGTAGIIAGAAGELAYAEAIGKPNSVVIGVETLDIANSGDPETITFQEEGRTHMEAELDKVNAASGLSSSFGGIAVHHYDSYRALPSYWGPGGVFWTAPEDHEAPSAPAGTPTAVASEYQSIRLNYGMATDNLEVDRYIIYRSTVSGFTPTSADIAGLARGLNYQDKGLLPDTTYYYRVAARDLAGNIGPLSGEVSAVTGSTALKPMIVTDMQLSYTGAAAEASMKVRDYATGEVLTGAAIEGRFTYSAGRYAAAVTGADGRAAFTSEAIPTGRQAGLEPRRVQAPGYYYASAHDLPHTTALLPHGGLSGLTLSVGEWDKPFAAGDKAYTVTVKSNVSSLQVTPVTAKATDAVRINGMTVASGTAASVTIGSEPVDVPVLVYHEDGTVDLYLLRIEKSALADPVVPVTMDAYVHEHQPSVNFGQEPVLEIADLPNGQGGGDRIAFMKAELNLSGTAVQTVTMNVYVTAAPASPVTLALKGYTGAQWTENGITWNKRPVSGGTNLGTVRVTGAGWYSADVTSYVLTATAAGLTPTFQWSDPNTSGIVVTLASSENSDNKPYLLVNSGM